jgi:SAM-dependent methyltransferase
MVPRWLRSLVGFARNRNSRPFRKVNPGWCPCCRADTEFIETGIWLRDQYLCARCGSIPRLRAINLTLDRCFPSWEQASIHESSPSNDFIRRYCPRYSWSFFFDGVPLGEEYQGSRCENLEELTFADETFDLFVTQDVLEHVFHPDRAVKEIMRVVKPGGAHVFTTPKHKALRRTIQRATLDGDTTVHMLEPQYHGNPIGDGRALVTWDYGDDFEVRLWEWCGYPTLTYIFRDRQFGIDGEYLEVFVTRKAQATCGPH